jgi:hypothetical protein
MMPSTQLASLWPGLTSAWHEGKPKGLCIAVLFAWAVCLLLLATFVWPGWIARWLVVLSWTGLAIYWLCELIRGQLRMAGVFTAGQDSEERFQLAQRAYLRGNWFEAEAELLELIQRVPDDVPALLLLVGVLRHTHRYRPALRRLEQLQLLDAAAAWAFEIHQEKKWIERALAESLTEQALVAEA